MPVLLYTLIAGTNIIVSYNENNSFLVFEPTLQITVQISAMLFSTKQQVFQILIV